MLTSQVDEGGTVNDNRWTERNQKAEFIASMVMGVLAFGALTVIAVVAIWIFSNA